MNNSMKTIKDIINSEPVFLNDWEKDKKFGVAMSFEDVFITKEEYDAKEAPYANVEAWHRYKITADKALQLFKDINILFATYGNENYSGDAWVLFEQNGFLYEVNGSHCSCYGLENQWQPEPVMLEELKNRVLNGNFGNDDYSGNQFKEQLKQFLGL